MISNFKRLDFAHIDCKASILVKGYPEEESIKIGCFGYYLEKDEEKIIIDTGIEDIDTVNLTKSSKDDWQRSKCEFSIEENLKRLQINEEEIDKIFLTHSHYDHISGICHYKNAHIYISVKEYEYLNSNGNPHKKFLTQVIDFLEQKKEKGYLTLIKEEYTEQDIHCITVGGHTPGSMLIYIEECLFTGDSIFLLEAIEKNLPIGFCNEPGNAQNALKLCRNHNGIVFTGHDFKCKKEITLCSI